MSLDDVIHQDRFKYIFIPADPNEEVEEREFQGREKDFKNLMRLHLSSTSLFNDQKNKFKQDLKREAAKHDNQHSVKDVTDNPINENVLDNLTQASGENYQIVPLTLPSKANGFEAINCYIDNIGRVKDLHTNSRATRIASRNIRGDCFVSKTFDDEEEFRRIDLSYHEYANMLKSPIEAQSQWDQTEIVQKMMKGEAPTSSTLNDAEGASALTHCHCCGEEKKELMRCSKCKKAVYCSQHCQRSDWKFHKRVCQ
eukprot:GHVN01016682.1.p1 GENE.GHVN01016682.1~~GHVN01016682.1.p1  ORF type:complete len:255 (+),score=51.85 GHVN01016682.1:121-885(+)